MIRVNEGKKHRVIGIRHVLKKFKESDLIDDETNYPEPAIKEIKDDLVRKAIKWYRIGYSRGIKQTLREFIKKSLVLHKDKNGHIFIEAKKKEISWNCSLKIKTGNDIKKIPLKKYKIKTKDLVLKRIK